LADTHRNHPQPDAPHDAAEFNTAMIHFYRGEVQRSNTWRNRLDTTTNWAVITAARRSRSSSARQQPALRDPDQLDPRRDLSADGSARYRYYEIWSSRVRIIETGYFAHL
jgi:uncharacterized membrane protein